MKLSDEVQAQIDFLKLPTTRWVQGYPAAGEACAIIRCPGDGTSSSISFNRYKGASELIKNCLPDPDGSYHIMGWNDKYAKSKEEVLAMLKKIRDTLIEAGY